MLHVTKLQSNHYFLSQCAGNSNQMHPNCFSCKTWLSGYQRFQKCQRKRMGTRFPDLHCAPRVFLSQKSSKGRSSQPHPLPQHNSIPACSCYCLYLAAEAGIKWPMSVYLWGRAVNQISIWASHVWPSNYLEVFDVDSSGSHHNLCIMLVFFFLTCSQSVAWM